MADASASATAPVRARARLAELVDSPRSQLLLTALVLTCGVAIAARDLDRGVWTDEFATLCKTARELSPAAFVRYLAREQHPVLHYGLVYLVRQLGLDGVVALRALNLLGVPLVLLALRHALRHGALSTAQACAVAALYASAPMFFSFAPELRAYALAYASSLCVTCVWLVVYAQPLTRREAWVWTGALALYCNLHYFALPLAALLTLTACIAQLRRGARASALWLALGSMLAAAPALALWGVQARATFAAGKMEHLDASTGAALRALTGVARDAAGRNGVVYVLVLLVVVALLRGRRAASRYRPLLVLAAVVLATYGGLALLALFRPILAERYLVVPAGAITVLCGALALGPGAPRFGVALACLAALLLQARVLARDPYREERWRASASAVAAEVRACPTTRVLAALQVDHTRNDRDSVAVWATGYRYYAAQLGFPIALLRRGDTVRGSGACPSLIWVEHAWRIAGAPLPEVLRELEVTVAGSAELREVGSGLIVVVR